MLRRFSLLFLAILFALGLTACDEGTPPTTKKVRPVKVVTVKETKNEIVRSFPGKVKASEEAVLSFLVPGQIIDLPTLEGQQVKEKQMLAKLDPKKYQETFNDMKATYIKAQAHYKRAAELVKDGYISEANYDNLKAAYLSAKANMNVAKKDLDDTVMYAPFAGVISVKYVDNFEHVKEKQRIFKLQDLSHVDIEINVPENVMLNIRKKANANDKSLVIFDSAPTKKYYATFKEFSAEADAETQTYRVVLKMPAPTDITVLPGMTATIRTKLPDFKSGGKSFIQIPSGAVFYEKKKTYVWLIDPNTMTVKKKEVTVSRMANDEIHVVSGLKVGDQIVGAGVHFLEDGQKVSYLKTNGSEK